MHKVLVVLSCFMIIFFSLVSIVESFWFPNYPGPASWNKTPYGMSSDCPQNHWGLCLSTFRHYPFWYIAKEWQYFNIQKASNEKLTSTPSYVVRSQILESLVELSHLSNKDKKKSLIYISKKASKFWNWPSERCSRIAMLVPAVSGLGLLDGFPSHHCYEKEGAASFTEYWYTKNLQLSSRSFTNEDKSFLCRKAVEKGAKNLYFINLKGKVSLWKC